MGLSEWKLVFDLVSTLLGIIGLMVIAYHVGYRNAKKDVLTELETKEKHSNVRAHFIDAD